jgi:hypothetical protein
MTDQRVQCNIEMLNIARRTQIAARRRPHTTSIATETQKLSDNLISHLWPPKNSHGIDRPRQNFLHSQYINAIICFEGSHQPLSVFGTPGIQWLRVTIFKETRVLLLSWPYHLLDFNPHSLGPNHRVEPTGFFSGLSQSRSLETSNSALSSFSTRFQGVISNPPP